MATVGMAWRNLWRSPRRTGLTMAAIAVGSLATVAVAAYMEGVFGRMVEATAEGVTGHAQLHAPGWRKSRDDTLTLSGSAALLLWVKKLPVVQGSAPRLWGSALLAIGDRSRNAQLLAVDPQAERETGRWTDQLASGRFLGSADVPELVLGAPLAKRLDVAVGTRVVVTSADVHSGEARSELLQIVGLLRSQNPLLDEGCAVIPLAFGQRLLGLPGRVHEVALHLRGVDIASSAAVKQAVAPLQSPQVEVVPWHEAEPVVAELAALQDKWLAVLLGLFFAVIAFVVAATLSMVLLERSWEFALLRALGATPWHLASVVLAEAALLGVLGALPGALAGDAVARWLHQRGIPMGEDITMIVSFVEPIRPIASLPRALAYAAVFAGLTVAVAAVAAWRAARVPALSALRSAQ